jgi:hypothetical protein
MNPSRGVTLLQLILALLGVGVIALAAVAVWPLDEIVVEHADAAVAAAGRAECPHSPTFTVQDSVVRPGSVTIVTRSISQLPQSAGLTDIPEFHDCQRFITGATYDSLYAIFAATRLAVIDSVLDSVAQAIGPTPDTPAVAAATIYSYEGTYATLGLSPGFTCLYLSRTDGQWDAWTVPVGMWVPKCGIVKAINQVPNVGRLVATPNQLPAYLTRSDIPPVARWDWDATDGEQYIGIQCGDRWCDVTDDGTVSAQPPVDVTDFDNDPSGAVPARNRDRVNLVKGWYDAQRLAIRSGTNTVPSDVWAVIVPHPTLGSHQAAFYAKRWTHAATAVANADYTGAVLTLKQGKRHKIYLCTGTAEECDLPATVPICIVPPDAEQWWAKVRYRRSIFRRVTVYQCAIRRPADPEVPVPGTARWRWLANDETTWQRCIQGCCELQ